MPLLDRRLSSVLRAPLNPDHYRAALGMTRNYPKPAANAVRYLFGSGTYPYRCRVRTPLGEVAPTLYSPHDMLTMNEVFCREDYRPPSPAPVAVDIGANIGLSALYFLTRAPAVRAYLFEPDPRNLARLRTNLAGYERRYVARELAIASTNGEAALGIEPSGRYGTLGEGHPEFPPADRIVVRTRAINEALEEILEREQLIDILKIDTEGTEVELVSSIDERLLDRIGSIFFESSSPQPLHASRYELRFSSLTNRLTKRAT